MKVRDIVNCHCSKCRRFHGHFGAYASVQREDLVILEDRGLKWFLSPTDETPNVQRGFCSDCGSSLFWHPKGRENIAVAAGSLDEPSQLKTIGHIWVSQIGDYHNITDGLPQFKKRWESS